MEEAQYRLNRLRDDIDYYVITTPPPELEEERLKKFFLEQQATWNDVSRRWIGFRKVGNPPQGEQASPNIVVT